MVETNSGVRLDRTIRAGVCGTWWSAATAAGHPLGLLQVDPALLALPAARERLAEAVAAVRSLNVAGVLRTTELVVEAGRAWLVVATVPAPTIADLLAGGVRLEASAAAAVAVDAGQALRQLHAAGLSHGDLAPDTVVLTPAGHAALVEVGVWAALRDRPTDVGLDATAWASLVRDLAGAVPQGADELLTAATIAAAGDLTTAVRRLSSDPAGFGDRESLIALLPAARQASPRAEPPIDSVPAVDTVVRLRFGPGVPDSAVAAPRKALAPQRGAAVGEPRRRRLRHVLVAAAVAVLVLLGAGASWWWLLGPH